MVGPGSDAPTCGCPREIPVAPDPAGTGMGAPSCGSSHKGRSESPVSAGPYTGAPTHGGPGEIPVAPGPPGTRAWCLHPRGPASRPWCRCRAGVGAGPGRRRERARGRGGGGRARGGAGRRGRGARAARARFSLHSPGSRRARAAAGWRLGSCPCSRCCCCYRAGGRRGPWATGTPCTGTAPTRSECGRGRRDPHREAGDGGVSPGPRGVGVAAGKDAAATRRGSR